MLLGQAGGVAPAELGLCRKLMNNHGNFIGSLGERDAAVSARQAEALGVEIYPGFPAAEVLFDENGEVRGHRHRRPGHRPRRASRKDDYTRGMELRGKYTVFAEGARGSLTKRLIRRFDLDRRPRPQKYGLGVKELWQVAPRQVRAGPGAAHDGLAAAPTGPAAAPGSTISTTTWSRSASSCTSTTRTRRCRRSRSSSASRPTR